MCVPKIRLFGQNLSQKQWEREIKQYSLADYKEIFNSDKISVKQTQYEGLSGILAKYETDQERSGIKLYSVGLAHLVGYRNSMIMIQCVSADLTQQGARKKFDAVSIDFLNFGNGLVLLDKYTVLESDEPDTVNARGIMILFSIIMLGMLVSLIMFLKRRFNNK